MHLTRFVDAVFKDPVAGVQHSAARLSDAAWVDKRSVPDLVHELHMGMTKEYEVCVAAAAKKIEYMIFGIGYRSQISAAQIAMM